MARRCIRLLCASLLVVAFAAAPAEVQAANRFLNKAKRAHKNLRYDDVLPLLKKALRISKADAEKVQIYALMAEMHVTYNRDVPARKAYVELLKLDPAFTLPDDSSPKVLAVLEEARAEIGVAAVAPGADGTAPPDDAGGSGGGEDAVVVAGGDGGADTAADVAADGAADGVGDGGADSAGADGTDGGTDTTTEAAAVDVGNGTDGLGPTDPMLTTRVEGPTPIYAQWWFWTAIGVVVIGGAVTGTVLATSGPDTPGGDFGPYNLP